MNKVIVSAEEVPLPSWSNQAEAFVKSVLTMLELRNWEVSLLFCNNRYIQALNAQYRNKNEPTDVLSFPVGETLANGTFLAGDIVVSLDALAENAQFFNVCADEELRRLLVHGILHLSGDDHATNDADEPMLARQEDLLCQCPVTHIKESVE